MAELLRRVKSTRAPKLSPAIDQSSTIAEQQILPIYKRKHYSIFTSTSNKRSTDHERIESADLIPTVTAVEARDHPGAVHQGSLTQLRQRLRHKASTFSLRTRDRQALARIEPTRRQLDTKTTKHEHFQHEQLLEDHTASFTVEYRTALRLSESPLNLSVLPDVTETVLYRSPTNSTVCTTDIAVQAAQSISLNKPPPLELQQTVSCSKDNSSPTGRSLPISTNPQALQVIHPQQHETATGSWVTMSDKNAPPPLPFEQLKEITTSACDEVFSSVSAYNHALTESWNTHIINKILSQLVSETTPAASSVSETDSTNTKPRQPKYKYIVNSTIIQHRSASESSAVRNGADDKIAGTLSERGGRRGMHSASGAFWDNSQDGMWSYKYDAAEAKGLDVVVGIIWVWVG